MNIFIIGEFEHTTAYIGVLLIMSMIVCYAQIRTIKQENGNETPVEIVKKCATCIIFSAGMLFIWVVMALSSLE